MTTQTQKANQPIKLRQLRAVCGYSQEALAIAWNISQAAISKLESGKSSMTFERVEQAASFYNCQLMNWCMMTSERCV